MASGTEPDPVASGYDAVYAGSRTSPTLARLWREHVLGADYPEGFEHISFIALPELRRMATELGVSAGSTFVDLACGAGGPALWIARESGARLVGIDLSAVGIACASARAAALGLSARARFAVAAFDRTGLGSRSADAVMSVDALQYAPSKRAALAEVARILRPGGRIAFAAFELEPERVAGLPVLGTDPVADYQPLLEGAGFTVHVYEETARWHERLTATYQAVSAALVALQEEMGRDAAAALALEVSLTLQRQPYRRRIFAAAVKRDG